MKYTYTEVVRDFLARWVEKGAPMMRGKGIMIMHRGKLYVSGGMLEITGLGRGQIGRALTELSEKKTTVTGPDGKLYRNVYEISENIRHKIEMKKDVDTFSI